MADDERRDSEIDETGVGRRQLPLDEEVRAPLTSEPASQLQPPFAPADTGSDGEDRNARNPGAIRAEDTEPYLALQYVARLFKIAAMVVIVALVAEVIAGVALEGPGALFPLFTEVIRGIVLAAILWGAGDVTILMIDVGHDVRAARVLLGRLSARQEMEQMSGRDGGI
jgi:hypothetical protein